ncbi:hypothetical protein FS837_002649 [Tulasnella sp. UAMH 9824]|nr:hypothetical protein FS837_002649 [Tulasnella sp. UAMH 9824]
MLGKPPGSVDPINSVPRGHKTSDRILDRLKSVIPAWWTIDPVDRPSSSDIFGQLAFLHKLETSRRGNNDVHVEQSTRSQGGRHRESISSLLAASDKKAAAKKPKIVYGSLPLQQGAENSTPGPESSIAVADDEEEEDCRLFLPAALVGLPSGSSLGPKPRRESVDSELLAATRYNQPSQRRRYRDKGNGQTAPDYHISGWYGTHLSKGSVGRNASFPAAILGQLAALEIAQEA